MILNVNKDIPEITKKLQAGIIAKWGSNKRELEELAIEIFDITFKHNIRFDILWIPRKRNELADKFSKTIDYDDWYVTPDLFKILTIRRWGVATIDRFASEKIWKTVRFNSKHICPWTLGVDAFAFDWTLACVSSLFNRKNYKTLLLFKSRLQSNSSLPILDISDILATNRDKI